MKIASNIYDTAGRWNYEGLMRLHQISHRKLESFGKSQEDAQHRNNWRKNRGQPAGIMVVKTMYVFVWSSSKRTAS